MAVTLATAMRETAKRTGQFYSGTATAGSATTLVDTNNLLAADGFFAECFVKFLTGNNAGVVRRTSDFQSSSAQITFYGTLGASVAAGDTYEVYKRFSPSDLTTAINAARAIAWPSFAKRVVDITSLTTAANVFNYTLPDMGEWGLQQVEIADQNPALTYTILDDDTFDVQHNYDTTQKKTVRTLAFRPVVTALNVMMPQILPAMPYPRTLRLTFAKALTPLVADADELEMDDPQFEWLYQKSAAEAWKIYAAREPEANRKAALELAAVHEASAKTLKAALGNRKTDERLIHIGFDMVRTDGPAFTGH